MPFINGNCSMRIYPALKKIPEYVLAKGKKNLSEDVVIELNTIISELGRVSPEDQAVALCNIGLMNSYVNNFSEAKNNYYDSYKIDADDRVYSNYLLMLQRINEISTAFNEACDYLDRNPNNFAIFESIMQIAMKCPTIERIEKVQGYRKYQTEDFHLSKLRDEMIVEMNNDINLLKKYEVDIKFYEIYIGTALNLIHSICKSDVNIGSFENTDLGLITICMSSNYLEFSDIILLNEMFDNKIQVMLENGILDKASYFDNLSKISFIYSVGESKEEEVA